jgi:hypothetical protein
MWALWRVGAPGPAVALDPRAMTGASVAAPAFGSSAGATPVARELRRCTPPASGAPGPAGSVEPRAMTGREGRRPGARFVRRCRRRPRGRGGLRRCTHRRLARRMTRPPPASASGRTDGQARRIVPGTPATDSSHAAPVEQADAKPADSQELDSRCARARRLGHRRVRDRSGDLRCDVRRGAAEDGRTGLSARWREGHTPGWPCPLEPRSITGEGGRSGVRLVRRCHARDAGPAAVHAPAPRGARVRQQSQVVDSLRRAYDA